MSSSCSTNKGSDSTTEIDFDDPYIRMALGVVNKNNLDDAQKRLLRHMYKGPILDTDENSQVASFYDNRSVFITGGTGYIGKTLVEKLIRSCPKIRYVYLLVREKGNKAPQQRLNELLDSMIFTRINSQKNGRSTLRAKVRVVTGNITMPLYGIGDEQMRELSQNVSIVFNSAATVKFSEPIEYAVQKNVIPVRNLVEFCRKLSKLEALVHLSTAYSNCHNKDEIKEVVYESPIRPRDIIELVGKLKQSEDAIHDYRCLDKRLASESNNLSGTADDTHQAQMQDFRRAPPKTESLSEAFTSYTMHKSNRPNTYTLTKSIAEMFLSEQIALYPETFGPDKDRVAVSIVRPSVVASTSKQPIPGYVDFYGHNPSMRFTQIGVLQVMPSEDYLIADFVPLDMLINFLVCCGWFLAHKPTLSAKQNADANSTPGPISDNGIYVFNYVSGKINPLHSVYLGSETAKFGHIYPSKETMRLPSMTYYPYGRLFVLTYSINHKLPAYLMDKYTEFSNWLRSFSGEPPNTSKKTEQPPSALSMYYKLKQMTEALLPFSVNEWQIDNTNTLNLNAALSDEDRKLFDFDIKHVNWKEYLRSYNMGVRVLLHKDSVESLHRSRFKLRVRQAVYFTFVLLVLIAMEYGFFSLNKESKF